MRWDRPGRLARRLLLSHLVVVLAGATGFVFVTALVPSTVALGIGVVVAVVAAVVASTVLAVRLARPIEQLADVAASLGRGRVDVRAALPGADDELLDLTFAFNAMAARIEATETARRQLLRDLTHELRTPLASIEGYLEAIRDGVVEPDGETLATMRTAAVRMHRLIDDLTDVSRAEEGVLELRRAPLDVAAVADHVVEELRPGFTASDIDLVVHADGGAVVDGDHDRIAQVLSNLLVNARTHAASRVTVTVRHDRSVRVTVDDDGAGISAEDLPRVFDRFFRAESATPTHGSGLGLTIARSLARAHGGELTASSGVPGAGATFTLELPSKEPP